MSAWSKFEKVNTVVGFTSTICTCVGMVLHNYVTVQVSVLFLIPSAILFYLYRKERIRDKATSIELEGLSLSCINLSNRRRNSNHCFRVHHARHTFRIQEKDLYYKYEYSGSCISRPESNGFAFTVDADRFIPFKELDCYGFDMRTDPQESVAIKPLLIGPDSIAKKLLLPFTQPIRKGDPFHVTFYAVIPNCINYGKDYMGTTLTLGRDYLVEEFITTILFTGRAPGWVRFYDITNGNVKLLASTLAKTSDGGVGCTTRICQIPSRQYVFVFDRSPDGQG